MRILAGMAVRKLEVLLHPARTGALVSPGIWDYVIPVAVLLLAGAAVLAVLIDWRAVRDASWL